MATPTSLETYFLQLINETRAKAGAKPLTFDGELLDSSDAHSAWMDRTDTFSHTGVNGSSAGARMTSVGYGWQAWGENIAYASGPLNQATVQQLHSMLVNSPGHYANIVNGKFEEVGIGLKAGTINGHNVVFVTENFGTPNAAERAEPNDVGSTPTTPISPTPVAGKTILGDSYNNTLRGGAGDDKLNGNGGKDVLIGGAGKDIFVFDTAREARGDTIRDFVHGEDRINLKGIDANTRATGDQAFKFIGKQGFHDVAGELRAYQSNGDTYLAGDTNGDADADFTIRIVGAHTFTASDFIA
ncbi:M10 family metallopeptidase C-terminal domain-containing protein [Pseudaminobacter sp. 19-2017]|uniref:M10 family metallopeptidase C-terminal domain-containing protein n=1 Tax=Pseudaminobacter soli (ex Zhang et al. 2022) TaxID=2831468 RepID=A0A942DVL4_9HYPH|nr:CAP domain-containing protein [Pseudaminobacter soli]MBS3647789.1 M10 family metallopeptidase C-terminal domain-containing protein [Pseudaminobacter soli]